MIGSVFGEQVSQSDLMHEMGHVLYHAQEHYPGSNCTSIMGHCPSYTGISLHDIADYADAFGMEEAPNSAYLQIIGTTQTKHHWEGQYLGGNGRAIHGERRYWIDRAIGSVGGPYNTYSSVAKVIDNNDNQTPNTITFTAMPAANQEWCFKMRGEAGGVSSGMATYWGPLSIAYCVARDASNVFTTSDRNGSVFFRVKNSSGSTISNVQVTLGPGQTFVCNLGNITNGSFASCSSGVGGPGYVNIHYNGAIKDTIGYE